MTHDEDHGTGQEMERCEHPACMLECWGVEVDVLAYAIIDCAWCSDDEAFDYAPRVAQAYAERRYRRNELWIRTQQAIARDIMGRAP